MSRIGKQPIAVPAGVKIGVAGQEISVEGPLGKLAWGFRPEVSAVYDEGKKQVLISRNAGWIRLNMPASIGKNFNPNEI